MLQLLHLLGTVSGNKGNALQALLPSLHLWETTFLNDSLSHLACVPSPANHITLVPL